MLEILNKERHEVEAPALVLEPHVEEILEPMSLPQNPQEPKLSLIHISEPTRLGMISYAVFCLKKKLIFKILNTILELFLS